MTNILSNISTVAMYGSYYDEPDIGSFLIPYLLPLIVALIFYFAACGLIVDAAVQKGHERGHLFAICFWLGIPGMIYVASLPDLVTRQKIDEILMVSGKSSSSTNVNEDKSTVHTENSTVNTKEIENENEYTNLVVGSITLVVIIVVVLFLIFS